MEVAIRPKRRSKSSIYQPADFIYDPANQTCICPAGKKLYHNGSSCHIKDGEYVKFCGPKMYCMPCTQRNQCLRHPERTPVRQVVFLKTRIPKSTHSHIEQMKHRIDSPEGREQYSRRLAIIEPVFGNIRHNKGLSRFSLRGLVKVDIQWKLYCMVHNLMKIHRYGMA